MCPDLRSWRHVPSKYQHISERKGGEDIGYSVVILWAVFTCLPLYLLALFISVVSEQCTGVAFFTASVLAGCIGLLAAAFSDDDDPEQTNSTGR